MFVFNSVSKRYRDGTVAVNNLNLTIPSHRITVMVGPSGCGKTTTLRLVNRMLEPTSGTIEWDGVPLHTKRKTALRRQMGYVIQSGGLFPHRTVLDNIMTVPRLVGWSSGKARSRAVELLGEVGLDRRLADRYPAQLSGGQLQRVGVARALAADPLVLLMDEPFSAIDPVIRNDLHALLLRLQTELEKTVIMITHDIDEAVKLGDQVVIMRVGGEIAQAGTPTELLNAPADDFVDGFIGRDRGYRSLSFTPAANLSISKVSAVRDPKLARPGEPTLVLGSAADPVGWADAQSGRTLPLGSVFDPRTDTLRAALDSALSSPFGLAVAVDSGTGRYIGVSSTEQITAIVRDERLDFARTYDPTAVRPVDEGPRPAAAEQSGRQAVEPVESTSSAESAEPAEPAEPAEEVEPVEPEQPGEPATTADSDPAPEGRR